MVNFNILDKFYIVFNNNIPTIFYLNLVGEYEEVFYSTFIYENLKWSEPKQLTNTQTNKLYFNILNDIDNNLYHVVFSENTQNQYSIKYMNYNIKDDTFINIFSVNGLISGQSFMFGPYFNSLSWYILNPL